jgi:hypothetical protein
MAKADEALACSTLCALDSSLSLSLSLSLSDSNGCGDGQVGRPGHGRAWRFTGGQAEP